MNLIFDLETNGLLDDVTTIHCLVINDLNAKQTIEFNAQGTCEPIVRGIEMLEDADNIIGHNIINYDLPCISKLYPWFTRRHNVVDTLLLSRLYHSDILSVDKRRNIAGKLDMMPLKLYGRHSLEAYGYRLGCFKGEFGKTTDWSEWSQEMQDYCVQDVNVTTKLWKHFLPYLTGLR